MRINKNHKHAYRHVLERSLKDKAAAREALDLLFDDDSDYIILHRRNPYIKTTALERLNMFWAWPLTLICAPFMYVIWGEMGWSEESTFGKFILRVTGHLPGDRQ